MIIKLKSLDGKKYKTDCANTKGIFRIIQSIPSKKAEPFKMWLAQVGQERIEEIENPELAQERMKEIYEKKGYPKNWIDKRLNQLKKIIYKLCRGVHICKNRLNWFFLSNLNKITKELLIWTLLKSFKSFLKFL